MRGRAVARSLSIDGLAIFQEMTMKWWKQQHSVCSECGVHFEPVTGYDARWGNLCATHRKAVKERDEKKDAVVSWASANWERLVKQMEDEAAEQRAAYNKMLQANIAQMANFQGQAQSQQGALMHGCFGGLGIGGHP